MTQQSFLFPDILSQRYATRTDKKRINMCIECVYRRPYDKIVGSLRRQTMFYFVLSGKQFKCHLQCKEK